MIKNKISVINALSLIIPIILIIVTSANVLLYADDYYYGTFLRNGFSGFISNNISHYINYNGRVIVHLLAQLVIPFGSFLYSLVSTSLLLILFYLGSSITNNNKIKYLTLCIGFVILIPVDILRESLFWKSSMFNYLYPTVMLSAVILTLINAYKQKYIRITGLLICFLSAAATEQTGLTVVAVTVIYFILHTKKENVIIFIKTFIFSFLGILTVFLSPATQKRFNTESTINSDLAHTLFNRFDNLYDKLMTFNGAGLFCLLFMLAFILLIKNKHFKYTTAICNIVIFTFIAFFNGNSIVNIIVLIVFSVYFSIAVIYMLLKKEYRNHGICMTAGALTILTIFFTNSMTSRTLLPFVLITITVTADIILKNLKFKDTFIYITVCIGVIAFIPTLNGYIQNKIIDSNNRKSFNQNIINYCIDYNDRYRYQMMHDDSFFYDTGYEYFRLEDKIMHFYSNNSPKIKVNGKTLVYPTINVNGLSYVPFPLIFEAFNGHKEYSDGIASFNYKDTVYYYNVSKHTLGYNDNIISLEDKCVQTVYSCMEINTACEIFDWTFTEKDDMIEFTEN